MRRWLWSLLLAGALGGGSYGVWQLVVRDGRAPLRYTTVPLGRGPVRARVTATGTLSALVTVQVGSQVSGRLLKIYVDYNSPVTRGQLIATLEPSLFEAAVRQARANVAAAEGQLAVYRARALDAARQLARQRLLGQRRLAALADVETSEANAVAADAQVKASRGQLAQARAQLYQARINLDYTRIVSPTSGVVISRNVDVGQTVAASFQAPVLFVIAEDLQKMQVDTSVAEADVGKLRAGMGASFTVDAFPGERFAGVLRQIRNAPQTLQNVVTYDAVLDVANPALRLRPGMTANVSFVWAERAAALRVPTAALRFRPPRLLHSERDGGARAVEGGEGPRREGRTAEERSVWILEGEALREVPVRVGLTDGTWTELTGGPLQGGEQVVTDVAAEKGEARTPRPPGGGRMF